jgi:hypothetical protein
MMVTMEGVGGKSRGCLYTKHVLLYLLGTACEERLLHQQKSEIGTLSRTHHSAHFLMPRGYAAAMQIHFTSTNWYVLAEGIHVLAHVADGKTIVAADRLL